ncbi:hypothetical protein T440DRAFT_471451 [Plenodomus tracheiphilus IPT5]|uniref:Uncharacterized protein n=1 Tax=Plenodomus tracheiphilus IPT5 TaxID=1408161 RepID=A0A6A7AXL3_9PLEO|nr:hypothetical protein T440DRAFT_471451 [Plenodomus tracheiphilus IPT5]
MPPRTSYSLAYSVVFRSQNGPTQGDTLMRFPTNKTSQRPELPDQSNHIPTYKLLRIPVSHSVCSIYTRHSEPHLDILVDKPLNVVLELIAIGPFTRIALPTWYVPCAIYNVVDERVVWETFGELVSIGVHNGDSRFWYPHAVPQLHATSKNVCAEIMRIVLITFALDAVSFTAASPIAQAGNVFRSEGADVQLGERPENRTAVVVMCILYTFLLALAQGEFCVG